MLIGESRVFVTQGKPASQTTAAKAVVASSRPRAHLSRDYMGSLTQSFAVVDAARHAGGGVIHRRTRTTLVRYGFGAAIDDSTANRGVPARDDFPKWFVI